MILYQFANNSSVCDRCYVWVSEAKVQRGCCKAKFFRGKVNKVRSTIKLIRLGATELGIS